MYTTAPAKSPGSRGLRFSSLIDPLVKSGYRVVAFDAPAHGRSSGSHVDLMDHADAIMAVTGKIGPVYGIIAHSFGAVPSKVERAAVFKSKHFETRKKLCREYY